MVVILSAAKDPGNEAKQYRILYAGGFAGFDDGGFQGLVEVVDQIFDGFEANGQANEIRCDSSLVLFIRGQL